MSETVHDAHVSFHSDALAEGALVVRSLRGREALGGEYAFELLLRPSEEEPLDDEVIDALLARPARVAFGAEESHALHGFVRELELLPVGARQGTAVTYRAMFVSKLWDATQVRGTWIYQDLALDGVLKDVMKDLGLREGDDFELRLQNRHPVWEYKVQYEETDAQFLRRVCEHEGVTVRVAQGDAGDKLIFSDHNGAFEPVAGFEALTYDPRDSAAGGAQVVTALGRLRRVVPTKVQLKDYNYRTPYTSVTGEAPVDESGVGFHVRYHEHVKDPQDATRLARIRAQEALWPRDIYRGRSRAYGLRAGARFTLDGHPLSAMDREYLVVEVEHAVTQGEGGEASAGYENTFTAIPTEVVYRPQRVTPKPRIAGLVHAHIDGLDNGAAAPLDEFGRYKVRLPFDNAIGPPGGKSSRWIRMAQPAAGAGYGMHFPLHIGTEVVLSHVDGDPDRPVIVASVPNGATASPVNQQNATQSAIRTRAGIRIEFEDDQ